MNSSYSFAFTSIHNAWGHCSYFQFTLRKAANVTQKVLLAYWLWHSIAANALMEKLGFFMEGSKERSLLRK